jgi:hypothetical protein
MIEKTESFERETLTSQKKKKGRCCAKGIFEFIKACWSSGVD